MLFAALGDATRLAIISRLSHGAPLSIARLTAGSVLTRQAVAKHLRVLESAGVVGSRRSGRESQYRLQPRCIEEMQRYLDGISRHWDTALANLKSLVED